MVTVLRPLSMSEILDRTFYLYRNHFLVFVGITAIPQLFILPLTLGGAAMVARRDPSTSGLLTFAGYLLFYLAVFISQAPTVTAVSALHLEKPISIGSAYSASRRSLVRVIWIVFLLFLAMFALFAILGGAITAAVVGLTTITGQTGTIIGAVVLIVPTAIFVVWWMLGWSLVIPVTVLEGGWFRVSMRRTRALAKGTRGRIFVIYFLMGILVFLVTLIVEFLLMLAVQFFHLRDFRKIQAAMQAMEAVGIFISTSLVGALATIGLSLIYYDQRVRKEGYDLQLMMSHLQVPAQVAAATAAPSV